VWSGLSELVDLVETYPPGSNTAHSLARKTMIKNTAARRSPIFRQSFPWIFFSSLALIKSFVAKGVLLLFGFMMFPFSDID
jgi:hypothetical protein